MTLKRYLCALIVPCAVLGSALPVGAELVVLNSGRTIPVRAHRIDGDKVVLVMRAGGEVTCDRSLIDRIVPDEVPEQDSSPDVRAALDGGPGQAQPFPVTPYDELITTLAQAHGVSPTLVQALIQVESGYRTTARSRRGAMGLMQLMPSTARHYNVRNPYDPKANIAAGVKHLKSLIDRWGVKMALAAYNAGEGAVRKFKGVPPYRETRDYVARILSLAGLE